MSSGRFISRNSPNNKIGSDPSIPRTGVITRVDKGKGKNELHRNDGKYDPQALNKHRHPGRPTSDLWQSPESSGSARRLFLSGKGRGSGGEVPPKKIKKAISKKLDQNRHGSEKFLHPL